MPLETCIRRRLLYAAEQSYSDTYTAADPYNHIGWAAPPRMLGPPRDRAFVGTIPEGVLVVFRGTREPFNPRDDDAVTTFRDWLNDGDCKLVEQDDFPGRVHHGFADSLDHLWSDVKSAVSAALAASGSQKLLIAGHSKGGALANLAAWRASRTWPDISIRVVTIAGARPGDEAFKTAYEANERIVTTRYTLQFDPVPDLPPGPDTSWLITRILGRLKSLGLSLGSDWNYWPVGKEEKDSRTWFERFRAWGSGFIAALPGRNVRTPLEQLFLAHSPKSYMSLVCGEGCPHD